MKLLPFLLLLSTALPVAAQHPTAQAIPVLAPFWRLDAQTGKVAFVGPTAQATAPASAQAEHLRTWMANTCKGLKWWEEQTGTDSTQVYKGLLRGVHQGVGLGFEVHLRHRPSGWQYELTDCLVRSPTGQPNLAHWLPLERQLHDVDFRADVDNFQQQLQQALPSL
jgi:hypothetical protein